MFMPNTTSRFLVKKLIATAGRTAWTIQVEDADRPKCFSRVEKHMEAATNFSSSFSILCYLFSASRRNKTSLNSNREIWKGFRTANGSIESSILDEHGNPSQLKMQFYQNRMHLSIPPTFRYVQSTLTSLVSRSKSRSRNVTPFE